MTYEKAAAVISSQLLSDATDADDLGETINNMREELGPAGFDLVTQKVLDEVEDKIPPDLFQQLKLSMGARA